MILEFIFRWAHVVFGVVWIGMLYYFNFVQTEYFKEAEAEAKADAMKKLAPRALWWFRWGAMFTLLTGLYLLYAVGAHNNLTGHPALWVGALAGILMFLNVWLIIWPNQQVVLGLKEGDGPASAARAGLASRTNTLLSGPMLFGMLASKHMYIDASPTGLYLALALIVALELNALYGKAGPMTSVRGVIHSSIALTIAIWLILAQVPGAGEAAQAETDADEILVDSDAAEAMEGDAAEAMEGDAAEAMEGDAAEAMEGDAAEAMEGDAAEAMEGDAAEAMEGDAAEATEGDAAEAMEDDAAEAMDDGADAAE